MLSNIFFLIFTFKILFFKHGNWELLWEGGVQCVLVELFEVSGATVNLKERLLVYPSASREFRRGFQGCFIGEEFQGVSRC